MQKGVFIDNRYSTGFHTMEEKVKHKCEGERQKLVRHSVCVCVCALVCSVLIPSRNVS
jgi:hypothetical protein